MKRRFSKSLGRRTLHPDASISTLDEDDSLELIDKLDHDPFLLILDQVQDPRNLGACLRTADGAGGFGCSPQRLVLLGLLKWCAMSQLELLKIFLWQEFVTCPVIWKNFLERGIRLLGTSDQAKKSIYQIIDDWSLRFGNGSGRNRDS